MKTVKTINLGSEIYFTLFALYLAKHHGMSQKQIARMWKWVDSKCSKSSVNINEYLDAKNELEDILSIKCTC